jgi:DNA-binding HxlR family transcriptional regulator
MWHGGDKDVGLLVRLSHHRWAIPVIVELHRAGGSKFVTLHHRLGVSKDSLSRTLGALIEMSYVIRNPGYGHPMRPEYILTPEGAAIAPSLARLTETLGQAAIEPQGLRKWSLPVLAVLRGGPHRFGQLRDALAGVTARALSQALSDLTVLGLIHRQGETYSLSAAARRVFRPSLPARCATAPVGLLRPG